MGRPPLRWHEALRGRLLLGAGLAVLALTLALTAAVRAGVVPELLAEQQRLRGENVAKVAARLEGMASTAEALCRALADAVRDVPLSDAALERLVVGHVQHPQYAGLIAGGGVWPEPGALVPGSERACVFISRDHQGALARFDGYNQASDSGYHQAFWYLPAAGLADGACTWSPAYVDPYSQVPMVTCTAGVRRDGRFWGAVTVDVRLDGFRDFCAGQAAVVGGWVAVTDPGGRLMSFPGEPRRHGEPASVGELAGEDPTFAPLAVVAAGTDHDEVRIARDPVLHEPVTVTIRSIPGPGWRVLAATPLRLAESAAWRIAGRATAVTAIAGVLVVLVGAWLAHHGLAAPLSAMRARLEAAGLDEPPGLDQSARTELGELAAAVNHRAERLRAETARRAAAEAELRAVVDGQAELIARCTPDWRTTFVNPAWCRFTGRGHASWIDAWTLSEVSAEGWEPLRRAAESLNPAAAATTVDVRMVPAPGDDRARHVTWNLRGSFAGERLEALLLVGRDVSEMAAAREREQRQQRQLIQADRMISLGILTSGMAHEINNPNQVITMNASLLAKVWADLAPHLAGAAERAPHDRPGGLPWAVIRDQLPATVEDIRQGAQRIGRIVADLKDFARSDGAGMDEPVELNALVRTAAQFCAHLLRPDQCRFSLQLAADLPPLRGNAQRLEQVVVNLLTNAVQALTAADQAVEITTGGSPREVVIEVRDEGRGIPSRLLPHLTDPFFTTKRSQGGTGLGLWVISGIIRDHGGKLDFRSQPGRGTVVTVRLPLAAQGAPT